MAMSLSLRAALPAMVAAVGQWTWMGGSLDLCADEVDVKCRGVYEGSSQAPGARCCGHSWAPSDEAVAYVFGGYGYDGEGKLGYLNDLWRVNLSTPEPTWAFLGGSVSADSRGSAEWPIARHYASYGFDSQSDSFWIFSGQGVDDEFLPDLWRLDVGKLAWEFKGNFSQPTPRKWSNFWSSNQHMWMLSGNQAGLLQLNDMWELDYSTGEWNLVYDHSDDMWGHYNGSSVQPGARSSAFTMTDEHGDLWAYAGIGYGAEPHRGVTSDMWRFDVRTRSWSFEGGDAGDCEVAGTCSARGVGAENALPSARHAGYNFAKPGPSGRMLVLGGEHLGDAEVWNDLWSFDTVGREKWTVEAGDCNVPNLLNATAGVQGIEAMINNPQSRFGGNAWVDSNGDAWIFSGGPVTGYAQDLWRFRWTETEFV